MPTAVIAVVSNSVQSNYFIGKVSHTTDEVFAAISPDPCPHKATVRQCNNADKKFAIATEKIPQLLFILDTTQRNKTNVKQDKQIQESCLKVR